VRYFETRFLEPAVDFLDSLDEKLAAKVIYNIDLAEQTNDPRLLKKLNDDIWEFRTNYAGNQIRLLAFWDKRQKKQTIVVATHGFIKKVDRVPGKEITRAQNLREKYFENT
jgi:phage-related protein